MKPYFAEAGRFANFSSVDIPRKKVMNSSFQKFKSDDYFRIVLGWYKTHQRDWRYHKILGLAEQAIFLLRKYDYIQNQEYSILSP